MIAFTNIALTEEKKIDFFTAYFHQSFMINGGNILVFQRILDYANIREIMR